MKDFEVEKGLNLKFKCIILATLAIAFIVAFIPLWQIGVDNMLRYDLILSQQQLQELDSEERALRASYSDLEQKIDESIIYVNANATH